MSIELKLRVSPSVTFYFSDGEIFVNCADTGNTFEVSMDTINLMNRFRQWTTFIEVLEELKADEYDISDDELKSIIRELEEAGMLVAYS